jgi:uncharacterized protein
LAALLLMNTVQAQPVPGQSDTAASFSCELASTEVEIMICQNGELARLDRMVSFRYHELLKQSADPIAVRDEERQWLREQRDPCQTESCLQNVYRQRFYDLNKEIFQQQIAARQQAALALSAANHPVTPLALAQPPVRKHKRQPLAASQAEDAAANTDASAADAESTGEAPVQRTASATAFSAASQPADAANTTTPEQPLSEWDKMLDDVTHLLVIASVISFFVLLGMGVTDRVVIFYDSKDLSFSILSVIGYPLLWVFHRFMESWLFSHLLLLLAVVVSMYSIIRTFTSAIRHNGPVLGIVVGIFKVLISFMGILILFLAGVRASQRDSTTKDVLIAALMGGIVGYVFYLLVNGPEVEDRRKYETWEKAEQRREQNTRRNAESNTSREQHARQERESTRDFDATSAPGTRRWFDVLGVPENATMEVIHRAYRQLMSQYHPDKTASLGPELRELAERKAKEINAAFDHVRKRHGMAS